MESVLKNYEAEKQIDHNAAHELKRKILMLYNYLDECWNKMHSLTCEFIFDSKNDNKLNNLILLNV